jgi:hypothetical protein
MPQNSCRTTELVKQKPVYKCVLYDRSKFVFRVVPKYPCKIPWYSIVVDILLSSNRYKSMVVCNIESQLRCYKTELQNNTNQYGFKIVGNIVQCRFCRPDQCCQMVYFQTKNANLGKFWTVLQFKLLVYFVAILVYFSLFGMLYQGKSGNPGSDWQ